MREMKDSGVEWIGEIPKDWDTIANKKRFSVREAWWKLGGRTPRRPITTAIMLQGC